MGNTEACLTCGLSIDGIDRSVKHFGCPGQISDLERANIDAVRKHAIENYSTGGWDNIVECYEDKDILEVVKQALNPAEAIKMMTEIAGIHEERYREAVGPDCVCERCGQTYPYEVGHFCKAQAEYL